MWRASQDPEPRLLPLPSEPVPVGARGARASGCGRMGGGTAPMRSRATFGVRRPERLSSRAPSYGKPGPRREPSGSVPAPLSPARGHLLAARPLRGARRQRPARATWPFKGRWLGPPATRLAFPRLSGAPSREGGPAQRLLPLLSLPLLPPLSLGVVVPAGRLLGAGCCRGPAGAKFCRRGTVTVLPPESVPLSSVEKRKK